MKNFKETIKKNKTAVILAVFLLLSLIVLLGYNDYSKFNNFKNDTSVILEQESSRQDALLADYTNFRAQPFKTDLALSFSLIKKHQAEPMAYILFSERIVSLMYQSKINLGNNKFLTVTPEEKAIAHQRAQEVLSLYKTNKALFHAPSQQIKAASLQHSSLLTHVAYSNLSPSMQSANNALDIKTRKVLSRLDPAQTGAWQKYYDEVDVYMTNPKGLPVPSAPDLILPN